MCQPRSPCWKIDTRYDVTGVAKYISDCCYQGWYYRVLEAGEADVGDELILLERNPDPMFIKEFWTGWRERPPDVDKLGRFLVTSGLAPVWQRYLTERLTFLREHPSVNAPIVPAVHARREWRRSLMMSPQESHGRRLIKFPTSSGFGSPRSCQWLPS